MAAGGDITRTIRIQGKSDGLKDMTADLRGAEDAYKSFGSTISNSVSSTGIGAIALGVTAGAAALIGLGELLAKTEKSFGDMQTEAKRAGLALADFQGLQFAANVGGVKDFASGAEKMAANLDEASRKTNDLSKLLDANDIKFKSGNSLLMDQNKLWDTARDLISRAANEQQKIKVADMLGLSKEWVPVLDKSAEAFAASRTEASRLGLIISDDVIAGAKRFDDEWRKSSLTLETQVKASLAGLLPVIDDLIEKAKNFIPSLLPTDFMGNAGRAAEILGKVSENATAIEQVMGFGLAVKALTGNLSDQQKTLVDRAIAEKNEQKMWADIAIGWEGAAAAGQKVIAINKAIGNPTKIPGDPAERDAFDRFIDQQKKVDAARQADIQTTGLAAGAHANLRIQLQGEAILERDGVADTEARRKALADLAKQAGDTAAALAKAQINNDILFGRRSALLTSQDVQIATQLRAIYDNDIPRALDSSEAAALRLNNQLSTVSQQAFSSLNNSLLDFETGTKKGKDALIDFEKQFTRSLLNMMNQMIIIQPIARSLQSVFGMFGFGGGATDVKNGFVPSINGGGIIPGSARGNVFSGGNVIPFSGGGIVDRPTLFPMAGGAGLMGEAGPEAIVPLRRGPDGRLGVSSTGGGGAAPAVTVQVNNYAGSDTETKQSRQPGPDGEKIVIDIVKKAHARGAFDDANAGLYGLRRRKVR